MDLFSFFHGYLSFFLSFTKKSKLNNNRLNKQNMSSQTIELGATTSSSTTLLITTTSSNSKCRHRWRSTCHVIRFSLQKKPTTTATKYFEEEEEEESPLSSLPYTSLPPPPTTRRTSSSKSFVAIDISDEQEEEKNHIARILKEKDFKSLLQFGGVDRVRRVLLSQRQHSSSDSQKTTTTVDNGTRFSGFLWNSCKQNCYTVSMLLISAIISFATEFLQEGPKYGWHDGVAIIFTVILLLTFSSTSNFWRQRKLAKKIGEARFTVERGERGERVDLSISDIVVGDLVFLRPHDEVPADGLFFSLGILIVMPKGIKKQKIDREENPFLIADSKVIAGHGWMLVTSSVGNKSNLAEMNKGLLESLIEKPISYIDKVALLIYTLVALVVLIRLICKKDGDSGGLPEIKGNVPFGLMMEVLEGIFLRTRGNISNLGGLLVLLVLCVQHGVPLIIAFSHRYNIDKVVLDQEAILNDLSACTKMGLVTVICIDVSGEIISKPMEVSKIWIGERETDISKVENGSETDLNNVLDKLKEGVGLSVIAPELSFSPMSNALASWEETTWQMDIKTCTEKFDILKHSKLNSDKESSGVLVRKVMANEQVQHYLHWSGDASTILKMCSKYYDSEGKCHAMANQEIDFEQVINDMKDSGLVPFAFAYRKTDVQEEVEQHELTLLALIGLKYKCQESTKLALKNLQNNGVHIKLISEDDIIAYELGIQVPTYGGFLEGEQFKDLNDKARFDKVEQAVIMASFSAEDKLLMVKCLQDNGHVVAFIEPWLITNHTSQVLKAADVGIVHNSLSRVMNKESCGISITCFNALKPIVRDGRSKYHNIQKFIQLQITASISGLLLTLITTMSIGKSPLTAIQLIWVNLLMYLLGAIIMAMELSNEEELAKKPSNDRNQPVLTKKIWKNIVIQVLYQTLACMILEFGGHVSDDSERKIRKTMIFNTFLLCQLFNLVNTIHLLKREVFNIVVHSYCFTVALSVCFVMQVVVIEYANGLADCMQLNAARWVVCILIGALSWVFEWTLNIILLTNCAASPFDSPPNHNLDTLFIRLLLFPLGLMGITYVN